MSDENSIPIDYKLVIKLKNAISSIKEAKGIDPQFDPYVQLLIDNIHKVMMFYIANKKSSEEREYKRMMDTYFSEKREERPSIKSKY